MFNVILKLQIIFIFQKNEVIIMRRKIENFLIIVGLLALFAAGSIVFNHDIKFDSSTIPVQTKDWTINMFN